MKKLTYDDLTKMQNEKTYYGFGYLGHSFRSAITDKSLLNAAYKMGLSYSDLFLWANSRYARHFMDTNPKAKSSNFMQAICNVIHELRKEKE